MFLSARLDGQLLGVAALKQLDEVHGERKSLHTVEAARGQRVGRALVEHLLAVAADRNFRRVSLETGIMEAFAPARSLSAQVGFSPCAPFGDYVSSPTRPGMTIEIEPAAHTTDDERRAEGPSAGCCT